MHGFAVILNFFYVYTVDFSLYFIFLINFLQAFAANIARDVPMVVLIGRFSKICPKGLEATGVTLLISLCNTSIVIGGQLSIYLVSYFNIKPGYYERSFYGYSVSCLMTALLSSVSPLFSLIKLKAYN